MSYSKVVGISNIFLITTKINNRNGYVSRPKVCIIPMSTNIMIYISADKKTKELELNNIQDSNESILFQVLY